MTSVKLSPSKVVFHVTLPGSSWGTQVWDQLFIAWRLLDHMGTINLSHHPMRRRAGVYRHSKETFKSPPSISQAQIKACRHSCCVLVQVGIEGCPACNPLEVLIAHGDHSSHFSTFICSRSPVLCLRGNWMGPLGHGERPSPGSPRASSPELLFTSGFLFGVLPPGGLSSLSPQMWI